MYNLVLHRKTVINNLGNYHIKNTFTNNTNIKLSNISLKTFINTNKSIFDSTKKISTNFYNQNKFNFVSDGANPKLKRKFYKKTDLTIMQISNKEEFIKVNEFQKLEKEEDVNNENNLKNEISDFLQDEKFENLTRMELQYDLFKLKLKIFDEPTQKNLNKNFEKLRTLFAGSLFHKKYYGVLLDNRRCKSMHLDELKIPTKRLALALAEEWQSQKDIINLYKMHLVIFNFQNLI
jgi:hypothetical protein